MMKWILPIFLLVCSCQKEDRPININDLLYPTIKLNQDINSELISPELKLLNGVRLNLFSFIQVNETGAQIKYCLWGSKNDSEVELGLTQSLAGIECKSSTSRPTLWNKKFKGKLEIQIIKEAPRKIILRNNEDQKNELEIELPTVSFSDPSRYVRYHSGKKAKDLSSVIIMNQEKSALENDSVLSPADGDYSSNRLSICHRMNDKCEVEIEYQCDKCPGAWVEVYERTCPQGNTKVCMSEKCGQRGQPACLLGADWLSPDIDPICTKEDQRVFCSPELVQYCDPDGVAICL